MSYFKNVNTLEDLRKEYKELLKEHHPDNGGNVADMQAVNAEYDQLFKMLKDKHTGNNAGNGSTYNTGYNKNMYDWENDRALREALSAVAGLDGLDIEICGQWIWISGNTYMHKTALKDAGFKWAGKKKQWYFHTETFRKKSRKVISMDDIRNCYGSTSVKPEQKILLA